MWLGHLSSLLVVCCLWLLCGNSIHGLTFNNVLDINANLTAPRHIHLSYGVTPGSIVVTYSTINFTNQSVVFYGFAKKGYGLAAVATGNSTKFVDDGPLKSVQYIHRITLANLKPNEKYMYQCGDPKAGPLSSVHYFHTLPSGTDYPARFVVYGDMGVQNAQSLPRLLNDTLLHNMYDAVLHVGDFAYDMADDNGKVGDAYMEMIEPLASRLPYMTTVGNHEHHYNFSNYKNRFSMPGGDGKNMFYSYNVGKAHIISMATEFYYYVYYGVSQISRQFTWLENDLKEATKPENRLKHPWIIFLGHRPIYCSNDNRDCHLSAEIIRNGIPIVHWYGLDNLLYKYGVDIAIWAHEHSYERLWPVWNSKVLNGTTHPGSPYTNPRATVHFITGSAGCKERHDHFHKIRPYSAFHSTDYGFSRMTVFNTTHVSWSQVSDDKNGAIIDAIWVIKDSHKPFVDY